MFYVFEKLYHVPWYIKINVCCIWRAIFQLGIGPSAASLPIFSNTESERLWMTDVNDNHRNKQAL